MSCVTRRLVFLLFFVSGFCGLVYQVIWTRLAFASFGILTPVLSVVLSVFMAGLSIGAWAGGCSIRTLVRRTGLSAAVFYAGVELVIGLSAFAVPRLFVWSERWLSTSGEMASGRYLVLSALLLAGSLLPWCLCMGATFPLMMAWVRERDPGQATSFSYLYLANVLGAMCGALLTAVLLVEVLGFRKTLWLAAAGNFAVAAVGCGLGWKQRNSAGLPLGEAEAVVNGPALRQDCHPPNRLTCGILFCTGFCAMAMEVVWMRAFTPVLKTQVYSYALIVFAYLGATAFGSLIYRRDLRRHSRHSTPALIAGLTVALLLPVIVNDPRFVGSSYFIEQGIGGGLGAVLVLASICPLCAILGYLTPSLIDDWAGGRPAEAGKAYALNILGCILGPLFASYVLLPAMTERHALILLGLPFLVLLALCGKLLTRWQRLGACVAVGAALTWSLKFTRDFEALLVNQRGNGSVRRDYAASVISCGEGRNKHLLVNGIGMTRLTPITKFMVHLPLAFHRGQPESALIVCFGMGTTYRSALSWDIETTTVELVPGVANAFGFYHADAARFLRHPKGRIVIDDGRRYLGRTDQKFDVIVIDPPPPVEAAGSSLLYSREFYELARLHLQTNGILAAWFPEGELPVKQAVLRSVWESFPYVRCFGSVEGWGWGLHILASAEPIENRTAAQLVARMPAAARSDLAEWFPSPDLSGPLELVLAREKPVEAILNRDPKIQITDDWPFNEYFLLRELGLF
jgi:spermidine synthase